MSIHDSVHRKILENKDEVDQWFSGQRENLKFPLYSSFDIRDSGCKIAPVDANVYPAGFNNICQVDQDTSIELMKAFLSAHYSNAKRIMLFPEEHTNNAYYLENVRSIKEIIDQAGYESIIAIPSASKQTLETSTGQTIEVHGANRDGGKVTVDGKEMDLIISNNDFSNTYEDFVSGLETPLNPPYEMGWHNRKKDLFFKHYNQLVEEFTDIIDLTPCLLKIFTETHAGFDINDEASRRVLADHVDTFMARLKQNYSDCNVQYDPYVYIKNSSGTYGLGVISAKSGEEVASWNNKSRKKMKAAKGGGGFGEVIIQEGVPTTLQDRDSHTAEPVIYMLGCQLTGGFLRTHEKKDATESLNSPGAVYKRLCVSDLKVSIEGNPLENVYGWIAKLGFLAVAREAKELGADFRGYSN